MGLFDFFRRRRGEASGENVFPPVVADLAAGPEAVEEPVATLADEVPVLVAHDVDLSTDGLIVDGWPITERTIAEFSALLGTPRVIHRSERKIEKNLTAPETWLVNWDAAGIMAWSKDGVTADTILMRLAEDPGWDSRVAKDNWEARPRCLFTGALTVDGQPPIRSIPESKLRSGVLMDFRLGDWKLYFTTTREAENFYEKETFSERCRMRESGAIAEHLRAHPNPFREVSFNYDPVKPPSGAWFHQPVDGPILKFDTPEFAYAIIEELMYNQELLTPKFNVFDFSKDLGEECFDPYDFPFQIIPKVREWFLELPIPAEFGARVERLCMDGGLMIYTQLAPEWDGEDDLFDIPTLTQAELAQFPNLKTIDVNGLLSPEAQEAAREAGITLVD
ncbi:MAG: hypothetical protein QM705_04385 [Ancrocorticia sp.]